MIELSKKKKFQDEEDLIDTSKNLNKKTFTVKT